MACVKYGDEALATETAVVPIGCYPDWRVNKKEAHVKACVDNDAHWRGVRLEDLRRMWVACSFCNDWATRAVKDEQKAARKKGTCP